MYKSHSRKSVKELRLISSFIFGFKDGWPRKQLNRVFFTQKKSKEALETHVSYVFS